MHKKVVLVQELAGQYKQRVFALGEHGCQGDETEPCIWVTRRGLDGTASTTRRRPHGSIQVCEAQNGEQRQMALVTKCLEGVWAVLERSSAGERGGLSLSV